MSKNPVQDSKEIGRGCVLLTRGRVLYYKAMLSFGSHDGQKKDALTGDGLGAFGNGMLGQLTRQDQADSRLDLARRDGRLLVDLGKLCRTTRGEYVCFSVT